MGTYGFERALSERPDADAAGEAVVVDWKET